MRMSSRRVVVAGCVLSHSGVPLPVLAACTPGMSCGRRATTALLICVISLGAFLAVFGYLYV